MFDTTTNSALEIKLVTVLLIGRVERFAVVADEITGSNACHIDLFVLDLRMNMQLHWVLQQLVHLGGGSVATDYIGLQWNNIAVLDVREGLEDIRRKLLDARSREARRVLLENTAPNSIWEIVVSVHDCGILSTLE